MAFVFRDLTDKEQVRAIDIGQRLLALGKKKTELQTARDAKAKEFEAMRAAYDVEWSNQTTAVVVEINKLSDELTAMRSV